MASKEKIQCPVRLYKDQYKKIKAKVIEDQITFQKLAEVLFNAYLKNNKEIARLVQKYGDEKNSKRRRFGLNSAEKEELLRMIEKECSPLYDLQKTIEEIKIEK